MATSTQATSAVGQLLKEVEELPPGEFEVFVSKILTLNARRKSKGLPAEESLLLKRINTPFSNKKMERYLSLDEKRQAETLSFEEHRELLTLVRQLEKYDVQKTQWIGQLALLRNVPFSQVLEQLGLNPAKHG